VDLKRTIKDGLQRLKNSLSEKSVNCQAECKELASRLSQSVEQKQEEDERRDSMEAKFKKLEEVFKRDKENATKDLSSICQQVEAIELEVNRIKTGDTTILVHAERTLVQLRDELNKLEASLESQRISIADDISTTVTSVIEHIERVNYRLQTLQEKAKQARRQIRETNSAVS